MVEDVDAPLPEIEEELPTRAEQPKSKYIANLIRTPEDNRSLVVKLADRLNEMEKSERKAYLDKVYEQLDIKTATEFKYFWKAWARKSQFPPPDELYWKTWLILAGRGFGKLFSLNTLVPTRYGWKLNKDLKVGDELFDEQGNICRITQVHPQQLPKKAYRLYFDDGTTIDAGEEHFWHTWTHADRKAYLRSQHENTNRDFPEDWINWSPKRITARYYISREKVEQAIELHKQGLSIRKIEKIVGANRAGLSRHIKAGKYIERPVVESEFRSFKKTTQDIVDTFTYGKRGDLNHSIPNARPLNLPEVELLVDPYVLGAWLGDGASKAGQITQDSADITFLREEIEKTGYQTTTYASLKDFGILKLSSDLKKLKVWGNKHIPDTYLRASISQRLALLQGLMDTDGHVNKEGSACEFTQSDERLARGVYELITSLGMKVSMNVREVRLNGIRKKDNWRLKFVPTMPIFRLPRKLERLNFNKTQSLKRRHRMIVKVEEIKPELMQCITVDSPNSTFLITESFVCTSNTRTGAEMVRQWVESGIRRIALVGPTTGDVLGVMITGDSGIQSVCPPWNQPTLNMNARRLTWPNGAIAEYFSAEEANRLRGPQFEKAWCIAGFVPVMMADGTEKPISKIRIGDYVMTRFGSRRVTDHVLTKQNAEVYRVTAENGKSVVGTYEHPFFVEGRGFVKLGELVVGDELVSTSTRVEEMVELVSYGYSYTKRKEEDVIPRLYNAKVQAIEKLEQREDVYDIGVEDAHEFFANSFVCHNCDEICLTQENLVKLEDREVPINQVKAGDIALTRKGLRRVVRSWKTSDSEEVWKLETSAGRILTGTENHPVYTLNNGFVPLSKLAAGDTLETWDITQARNLCLFGGEMQSGTSKTGTTKTEKDNFSTGNYIYPSTAGFRQAFMSTILTKIPQIIQSTISKHSPVPSIFYGTSLEASPLGTLQLAARLHGSSGQTARLGKLSAEIAALDFGLQGKGLVFVRELASSLGYGKTDWLKNGYRSKKSVSDVPNLLVRLENLLTTARLPVIRKLVGKILRIVLSAEFRSNVRAQKQNVVPGNVDMLGVPEKVVRVTKLPDRQAVYNLEIEDTPEYYANGILTHNCSWRYGQATYDMLQFGLRLGKHPQQIITTTPRPQKLLKSIMGMSTTYVTTGNTFENRANMAPSFFEEVKEKYGKSRLGRQELYAEVIDDVPGALFPRSVIDNNRIPLTDIKKLPDMLVVVVAVDPATTVTPHSAETGICVAAYGADDHFYVLELNGVKEESNEWGKRVLALYDQFQADRIVPEVNNGGNLVTDVIHRIRPHAPVIPVWASRGKIARAEPISTLYARGRVHHVGEFPSSEDQMTEYNPLENREGLKDRVDALVWAIQSLVDQTQHSKTEAPAIGGIRDKLVNFRVR